MTNYDHLPVVRGRAAIAAITLAVVVTLGACGSEGKAIGGKPTTTEATLTAEDCASNHRFVDGRCEAIPTTTTEPPTTTTTEPSTEGLTRKWAIDHMDQLNAAMTAMTTLTDSMTAGNIPESCDLATTTQAPIQSVLATDPPSPNFVSGMEHYLSGLQIMEEACVTYDADRLSDANDEFATAGEFMSAANDDLGIS